MAAEAAYAEREGQRAHAEFARDGRYIRRYLFGNKSASTIEGLTAVIENRYGTRSQRHEAADTDDDDWGVEEAISPEGGLAKNLVKELGDYVLDVKNGAIPSDDSVDVFAS